MRKLHLAKALMAGNWDLIRKDLNTRPIESVSGDESVEVITEILHKYGITDKQLSLWGTGKPLREFLWSEEMADACVYLMERLDFKDINGHLNIGTGKEISIRDLAFLIKEKIGYSGDILFDDSKPDGTMRKLTDVSKLNSLGWRHSIEIDEGVERIYNWYIENLV